MSKLLLDENPILILPALAKAIGLNEAIVLQQIHYWLVTTPTTTKNVHHGKKWIYNSLEAWSAQFPFWSRNTINRTMKNLKEKGLILTDRFNRRKSDRTIWYTIEYSKLDKIEHSMHLPKMGNGYTQIGDMDSAKMGNPSTQNDTTLPEISHEIIPEIKTEIALPHGTAFSSAWSDWLTYRKERKVKTTTITIGKQLKMLSSVSEEDAVEMINRSITNGWQGLFELKRELKPSQYAHKSNLPDPSKPRKFDAQGYEVQ